MMSRYYVACDLGVESGRVLLATLHNDKIGLNEIHRFANQPTREKEHLEWNIPQLFNDVLLGLRGAATYEEPVDGISCNSWSGDYLLFEADGTLITPATHYLEDRTKLAAKKILSRLPWETLYAETGVGDSGYNSLFQLGAEPLGRLSRAHRLMSVADGFNYLLSGVSRAELSLASASQLYNPLTRSWSDRVLNTVRLPGKLLPPVVPSGTDLGPLQAQFATQVGLQETRVIASCANEIAAALVGLPISPGENWGYIQPGTATLIGTQLSAPLINDIARTLNFTNELGYGGTVCFHKREPGLWLLDECQRYWRSRGQSMEPDVLSHLAGCSPAFESLINPTDSRFQTPGDMPLKIEAFCRETRQTVPRKPGPVFRCILESLALMYRKTVLQIENLTGNPLTRLFVLGGSQSNSLLNYFIANATQVPVIVAAKETTSIGNVLVQGLTLGHIKSVEHARQISRNSFKTETIVPHAAAWTAAYERLTALSAG